MGETGGYIVHLPPTLDPTAEEFIPLNRIHFPVVAVGVPYSHFTTTTAAAPDVISPAHFSTSSTRSLLLTPVPLISQTALRKDLEVFGDVRAVQTDSLRYGIVTVHFYDIRHAETAFTAIRNHHLHCASFYSSFPHHPQFFAEPPPPGLVAGQPLWAHFVLPTDAFNVFPDGHNQGTIVVFNLDTSVSAYHLRQVFEAFGPIKEVRGTPWKKNQRFIEFFDTRDAAMALINMNGKEIHGKQVVIEFSKPGGGYGRRRKRFYKGPFNFNNNNMQPLSPPPRRFAAPFYSPHKLTPCNRGSPNRSVSSGSIVASMGSMSLNGGVGNNRNTVGEKMRHHSRRRKESSEESMAVESTEEQVPRRRHWKGKQQVKNHETTRYLIKLDAAIVDSSNSRDPRTTVMIKNIPNKYSQKLLLKMLDNHCIRCNEQIRDGEPLSSYDFVYLPIDFNNKCNVGYGFVNMTSPEATMRLYKAFHLQPWEVFNSRKICEVTYARVQGLEGLKEQFKNSRFPWEMEHYLPVVFSPPRDGRREVTEAVPIVEMMGNRHRTVCSSSSSTDQEESGGGDNSRIVGAGSPPSAEDAFSSKSGGVGYDNDDDTIEAEGGHV